MITKLILNYNNSCDYGRILPTGMCDKYDVVKKYMNEDAMWRYIYGEKYACYFGKSCVGKTTYLNNNNIKSINIDMIDDVKKIKPDDTDKKKILTIISSTLILAISSSSL